MLEKFVKLPISEWSYKTQEPSIRHIGPMAQDFYSAFGLGEDKRRIGSMDADGVLMAAIQGLNAKLNDKENENVRMKHQILQLQQRHGEKDRQIAEMSKRQEEMEARLAQLEHLLTPKKSRSARSSRE